MGGRLAGGGAAGRAGRASGRGSRPVGPARQPLAFPTHRRGRSRAGFCPPRLGAAARCPPPRRRKVCAPLETTKEDGLCSGHRPRRARVCRSGRVSAWPVLPIDATERARGVFPGRQPQGERCPGGQRCDVGCNGSIKCHTFPIFPWGTSFFYLAKGNPVGKSACRKTVRTGSCELTADLSGGGLNSAGNTCF